MFALAYLAALLVIYIAYIYKKYRDVIEKSKHIPGPPLVPILGNALAYVNKSAVEITKLQYDNGYIYGDFMKVILGTTLNIFMGDPKDIEVLLTSNALLTKTNEYDVAQEIFGEGLIFSTDKKWFTRRRLITPAFHFKILDQFVEVFDRNSKILVNQLKRNVGETVDVYQKLSLCAMVSSKEGKSMDIK
jgi:cytochrome P450 family 4